MARMIVRNLQPPPGTGHGPAVDVSDTDTLAGNIVWVSGDFVATFKIEGSVNGMDWLEVSSAISAPGVSKPDASGYAFVRIKVTSYTSGNIAVAITGRPLP